MSDKSEYESDLKTPVGKIVFSLEIGDVRDWKKRRKNSEKYRTGELPSFSLQRYPLKFDINCGSFSKTEQRKVLKMVFKDPMFDIKNKHLERFRADTVSIGGCIGIRIKGRTQQPDGTEWVLTTYAFADGEILYLFTLKNVKEYYDKNLSLFEESISTLRIIRKNIMKEWPWVLPERALEIEGGSTIGLQVGMARADPDRVPGLFGTALKMLEGQPVDYFLMVRNETKQVIWVSANLHTGAIKTDSFKEIESNKSHIFTWADLIKNYKELPLEIKIFADKKKTQLLGTDSTKLVFTSDEIKKLLNAKYDYSKAEIPSVSGWKEMKNFALNIPGTFADSTLQKKIVWRIFKKESLTHKGCLHSIIKVELVDSVSGIRLYKTEDGSLQFEEKLNNRGKRFVEKWYVKSCESESVYQVDLLKSPEGKVHLMSLN